MYSVIYSKRALKELQKLDKPTASIIYHWVDKNLNNCANPRQHGKALAGDKKKYWRYRIGVYRLIADIQDNVLRIEIISIAHRRSIYDR